MSAYFITATGTGVGKTFTTCALIHTARQHGRTVAAYKPVISGYDPEDAQSDTARIITALGGGAVENISPWRFRAPLSPDMAARQEQRNLTLGPLVDWSTGVRNGASLTLIETVGGLMVPLNAQHTTRHWMAASRLPLVMVTGSYLGAISHTLTTLEAARAAELTIAALIINESEGSTVPLAATHESIANHCHDIPLILAQPRVSSPQKATAIHLLLEHLA